MQQRRVEKVLRRGLWVAGGVGLVQALVFAIGWFLIYESTHESVAQSVEEVIVQANVTAAQSLVDNWGGIPSVEDPDSEDWARTQSAIESLELGGSGFACVLNTEGFISCHPDIRHDPSIGNFNMLEETVLDLEGNPLTSLQELEPGKLVRGQSSFGLGGDHYMAAVRDPNSSSILLVHQPVSGLVAAGEHVTSSMAKSMVLIGLALVSLTAFLAVRLFRSHDREMATWNAQLEDLVEERTGQLVEGHRTILFGIAKLAEYRDNDTGLHVERMCAFTRELALEYQRRFGGVTEDWIDDVGLAAAMHDIGKVSTPDHILLKPGRLTEEEFEVMKRHASVGEEALLAVRERVEDTRLIDLGIDIAGGHHERWDGGGYPRGVNGPNIPLAARIVALADVFDALMSKRVYKPAMPFDEVHRIITESSGGHFDPDIVICFEEIAEDLRRIHGELCDPVEPTSARPHAGSQAAA